MERINILSEYRDRSNAEISNIIIYDFQEFMTKGNGELLVLDFLNSMCIENLSAIDFKKWEDVKLKLIRKSIKNLK